ncbi:MAG: DNA polymerase ligase N-terminal domain-containing protein [Pseudomonadota bacterium]
MSLKFVIQKHDASHLHYDFRLEMDGMAKSWAVPKIPPQKVGEKRLAVQVEDHTIEYMGFEGVIEEGYGKGAVEIWDRGTYELESKKEDKIVFHLKGTRLKGKYVLLIPKWGTKAGKKQWLLMKAND